MPVKDRPWEDDIRRLEARMEARMQAVNTRFTGVDSRFSSLETRVDERCTAVENRVEERCSRIETRLDERCSRIETRLDEISHGHQATAARVEERFQHVDLRMDTMGTTLDKVSDKVDKLGSIVLFNSALCAGGIALGTVAVLI